MRYDDLGDPEFHPPGLGVAGGSYMAHATASETALTAELNDLLRLDHDAVQAYTLAIKLLQTKEYRKRIRRFRADHERHIDELHELIASHDGQPVDLPHLPTGAFKLAVQAVGRAAGDRGLLLAFKSNERQVRDKYMRAADERHPPDVDDVVRRAAQDEQKHYSWVLEALEDLGVSRDSPLGRVAEKFEVVHSRFTDAIEGTGRGGRRRGRLLVGGLAALVAYSLVRRRQRSARW
jgi:rubrerythrin